MTIKENITISDCDKVYSDESVSNICDEVGVQLGKNGVDELLGKEFGGVELSGGQWQRLAIARGIYRDNNLIIFDEPTAAIDPIEESKIFNLLCKYSQGRTAIIVTHRLALTKMADRILVMKDGKIVQDGTHKQLMDEDGEYKKLYQMQMKWYKDA